MSEAEDFEPYRAIKDVARKVGNFVGVKRSTSKEGGPGTRRTDVEVREAKAVPKKDISRQNEAARRYSMRGRSRVSSR